MAGMGAVSRILYGMGRDNILPKKFFGHLSKRFMTPVNNIVLTTLIALSAIFYSDNVFGAASLIAFGAVCGFFMVNLSVIFHYYIKLNKRKGFDLCRYLIAPIIGMGSLVVVFIYMDSSAKVLGLVWMAIGLVYLAFKTKFFKELPPEMTLGE
jgi:amino acid transporter